ncbi:borealin-like [Phlebotomus argentipes]|uniref:borealin-like n=1 Tax=Phlebotomus argentipes TaxID=94469 RepID=UPI00289322A9|nr:borealin-like [Phlebotomus argentipes]
MPRTKVPKNAKRNREQTLEDLEAATLREFDETVEAQVADLEIKHSHNLQAIETAIHSFLASLPDNVLLMKMGDLQAMSGAKTLLEASKTSNQMESMSSNSVVNSTHTRHQSREDEGYITEHRTSEQAPVMRGPLSSARGRMRRSRSAAGALPSVSKLQPSRLKPPTPMQRPPMPHTEHRSRPATRTPAEAPRPKAASADRISHIRPKVDIQEPLALLRFPRVGETLVSLTGSPVAGYAATHDATASVNIPTLDGVLSLRPTALTSLDTRMVSQIDDETLRSLQQLQENIGSLMKMHARK